MDFYAVMHHFGTLTTILAIIRRQQLLIVSLMTLSLEEFAENYSHQIWET